MNSNGRIERISSYDLDAHLRQPQQEWDLWSHPSRNRALAVRLVKRRLNDRIPESISASRQTAVGRYGELSITAIMHSERL